MLAYKISMEKRRMKHTECEDCKLSNNDCGHHFEMNGVINYDIASLSACDQYGNCEFFQQKERPQDDLISREALKEEAETVTLWNGDVRRFVSYETIDNVPTVGLKDIYQEGHYDGHLEGYTKAINEERSQGKWEIAFHDCTGAYYLCSCCGEGRAVINGEDYASLDEFHFCPNCGADMRGKQE